MVFASGNWSPTARSHRGVQHRACRTTSEQLGVSGVVAGPPSPRYTESAWLNDRNFACCGFAFSGLNESGVALQPSFTLVLACAYR
jgi:hypothetical protein